MKVINGSFQIVAAPSALVDKIKKAWPLRRAELIGADAEQPVTLPAADLARQ